MISWLPFQRVMLPQLGSIRQPHDQLRGEAVFVSAARSHHCRLALIFFKCNLRLPAGLRHVGSWRLGSPSGALPHSDTGAANTPVFKDGLKLTDKVIAVNGQETDGYLG